AFVLGRLRYCRYRPVAGGDSFNQGATLAGRLHACSRLTAWRDIDATSLASASSRETRIGSTPSISPGVLPRFDAGGTQSRAPIQAGSVPARYRAVDSTTVRRIIAPP